jgi:hypothetical protein
LFDEPVSDLLKRRDLGLEELLYRFLEKELQAALREEGFHPSADNPDEWVRKNRQAGE